MAPGLRAAVASAQVALELTRDGLARRLRQLRGVAGLLQRLHVLGDLAVLGGQLVHADLPGTRVLGQLAQRDAHVDQVLQAVEQRQGGLRVGRLRHVVRHRRPQRHGRYARVRARLLEDADDPGGTLVLRLLQVHPLRQVRVRGGAADRHRTCVRGVTEQRAQDHHQLDAQLVGEAQQFVAERAPAHGRFDAPDEHQVTRLLAADPDHREARRRPCDLSHSGVHPHRGPVDLEVVVVLGVQGREDLALPLLVQVRDRGGGGVAGVVPALERGHHHWVDQLGNPLQLDHPAPPSDPSSRTPQPYGVRRGRPQPPCTGE